MQKKRGSTYFGVYFPPFKEEKYGAGTITIRFVVEGSVISKKNNELTVTKTVDAKNRLKKKVLHGRLVSLEDALKAIDEVESVFVGNKQYGAFLRENKPKIEEQKAFWLSKLGAKGLTFPLKNKATMSLRVYFKDEYIQDTISKQETIQDLLVECDVLADDDYCVMNPYKAAGALFKNEISSTRVFVSLSFRLDGKEENKKIAQRISQKEKKRANKIEKVALILKK